MTSPTLDDLKAAQVTLQAAVAGQDGYDWNNPAKHATAVRLAREEVNRLTRALKASGVLTRTAHEQLEARLDAAYPSARHKDEVDFEGGRYARWARPATRSLSGRAMTWETGRSRLDPSEAAATD